MARTAEDWSTLYYEQQALHTEATGALTQQVRRLEEKLAEAQAHRAKLIEAVEDECRKRDAAINALSEASRWMPVSERLPVTHGEQYLTFSVEWGRTVRTFEEKGTYRGFCWRDEAGEHVTHWMPLPEAPK